MSDTAVLVLSVATLISALQNFTPIFSILKAYKSKNLDGISHTYLVSGFINSSNWLIYAAKIDDWGFFKASIPPVPMFLTYIIAYHFIRNDFRAFFTRAILLEIAILGTLGKFASKDLMGIVMMAGTFFNYASPLEKVQTVLAQRDTNLIDTNLMFMATINTGLWLFYGVLVDDSYMVIMYSCSLVMCFLQIAIVAFVTLSNKNLLYSIFFLFQTLVF
jgi:uncharacterized protein with PQ loop repeat